MTSDMMKFRSGPYEIYEHGSVIGGGNGPIEMTFDEGATGGPVSYRVIFKNDYVNPNCRASFKKVPPNIMEMYFFNFNGVIDTGSPVPIKLGSLFNRSLYLAYRIDSMANVADKIFHYTWFLGEGSR